MRRAAPMAALMLLQYALLAANFRAIALGLYAPTVATDGAIAFVGWTLLKRVQAAETRWEKAGYVAGGCAGSALGIFLTKAAFGG